MRKLGSRAFVLCSVLLLLSPAIFADQVSDGGFESATASVYSPGAIGDGWTVLSGLISILNNSEGYGTAHSGVQFADLNYAFSQNQLSQTVSTVSGQNYQVSFWLSDDVGGNPLTVAFGGTTLFSGTTTALGTGNYELLSYDVMATGNSEALTFTAQYEYPGAGVGTVIDDVSVNAVATPEPCSVFLLGSGLAGLAGLIRRKMLR